MRKLIIAAMSACVSYYVFAAPSPKAVYDKARRTLTFYCDELDHKGPANEVYDIDSKGTCSWGAATGATNAVFHSSFYQFQPTTMQLWFKGFSSLQGVAGLENIDYSQVTSMHQLFRLATGLKILDLRHLDTSKTTNTARMFEDCGSLTTIYVDDLFDTSKVTQGGSTFAATKSTKNVLPIVGGNGTKWSSSNTGVDYARVDTADNPGYFTYKARAVAPTITAVSLAAISSTSATICVDGTNLARGSMEIKLFDGDTVVKTATVSDFGETAFDGLTPNTTYSVQVTATSTYGSTTDNTFSFATLATPADSWLYDATNGTIEWGGWTFAAAANSSKTPTMLQVKTVSAWPAVIAPLDFSLPVKDADGQVYTIVTLNPGFSTSKNYKGGGTQPQCLRVGELSLPPEVVTVSSYAFGGCINMSGRIAFPSTAKTMGIGAFCDCYNIELDGGSTSGLTTIQQYAFREVHVVGDLDLSAATAIPRGSFQNTSVGNVRFGPSLTSIGGASGAGAFGGCVNLTNVSFDAKASCAISEGDAFNGCTGLEEIDFEGVTKLAAESSDKPSHSNINGCSNLKRIIFSSKLETLTTNSFANASALEEVVFKGPPPSNIQLPLFFNYAKTKKITTLVRASQVAVENSAGVCWNDYASEGGVLKSGSTWAEAYAESGIDLSMRPLILMPNGLMLIVR